MMMNRRRTALALAATTLGPAAWAEAADESADVPVEHFFDKAQLSRAVLNPAGTHVALCLSSEGGRRRLGVVDLATMGVKTVAAPTDGDVHNAYWVSDRRLVYFTGDEDRGGAWFRHLAVDLDAKDRVMLGSGTPVLQGPQVDESFLTEIPQDNSEGWGFLKLVRSHTRTGKVHEFDVPPWSKAFLIDDQGEPAVALTSKGDRSLVHWRQGDTWRVVKEMDRFFGESFTLQGLTADGQIYVTARRDQDQTALYTFDPASGQLSAKPILALAQFDMVPTLVQGEKGLLGVHVQADALTTVWFDEGIKTLQARIDTLLPNTGNHLSLPRRGNSPWVLVWAFSDRQPVMALLYNRESDKLSLLSRSRPKIRPALMSAMAYRPYKARDGLTIPAYLTLPRSAGARRPLPMVVLVHGGPFVRGGSWHWQAEVQFLASRGYAVLQPEFRGSIGFGDRHFKAGWKQWGQAMQDDLADGARWAIEQGIADPARIAIAGASYGGYAAMMGLAKQPDVFACAVNWVGVTDLDLLYGAYWSDMTGVYKKYGMPTVLGDREKDAEVLRANSPLHLAKQIRKPVLMAYGKRDERVPIEHGERMRDALKHNPDVEWVEYEKEGHGWFLLDTQKDFWTRVERFLAKHLKAPRA